MIFRSQVYMKYFVDFRISDYSLATLKFEGRCFNKLQCIGRFLFLNKDNFKIALEVVSVNLYLNVIPNERILLPGTKFKSILCLFFFLHVWLVKWNNIVKILLYKFQQLLKQVPVYFHCIVLPVVPKTKELFPPPFSFIPCSKEEGGVWLTVAGKAKNSKKGFLFQELIMKITWLWFVT